MSPRKPSIRHEQVFENRPAQVEVFFDKIGRIDSKSARAFLLSLVEYLQLGDTKDSRAVEVRRLRDDLVKVTQEKGEKGSGKMLALIRTYLYRNPEINLDQLAQEFYGQSKGTVVIDKEYQADVDEWKVGEKQRIKEEEERVAAEKEREEEVRFFVSRKDFTDKEKILRVVEGFLRKQKIETSQPFIDLQENFAKIDAVDKQKKLSPVDKQEWNRSAVRYFLEDEARVDLAKFEEFTTAEDRREGQVKLFISRPDMLRLVDWQKFLRQFNNFLVRESKDANRLSNLRLAFEKVDRKESKEDKDKLVQDLYREEIQKFLQQESDIDPAALGKFLSGPGASATEGAPEPEPAKEPMIERVRAPEVVVKPVETAVSPEEQSFQQTAGASLGKKEMSAKEKEPTPEQIRAVGEVAEAFSKAPATRPSAVDQIAQDIAEEVQKPEEATGSHENFVLGDKDIVEVTDEAPVATEVGDEEVVETASEQSPTLAPKRRTKVRTLVNRHAVGRRVWRGQPQAQTEWVNGEDKHKISVKAVPKPTSATVPVEHVAEITDRFAMPRELHSKVKVVAPEPEKSVGDKVGVFAVITDDAETATDKHVIPQERSSQEVAYLRLYEDVGNRLAHLAQCLKRFYGVDVANKRLDIYFKEWEAIGKKEKKNANAFYEYTNFLTAMNKGVARAEEELTTGVQQMIKEKVNKLSERWVALQSWLSELNEEAIRGLPRIYNLAQLPVGEALYRYVSQLYRDNEQKVRATVSTNNLTPEAKKEIDFVVVEKMYDEVEALERDFDIVKRLIAEFKADQEKNSLFGKLAKFFK